MKANSTPVQPMLRRRRIQINRTGRQELCAEKGHRNSPLDAANKARNKKVGFTHGRVEVIFANCKQHRNLRKTRLPRLRKKATHFGLAAIMHNLQKAARFVERYGHLPMNMQDTCASNWQKKPTNKQNTA